MCSLSPSLGPIRSVWTEIRFYVRSRLGEQADHLHASWGATSIDDLPVDRLRDLCGLILNQEMLAGGP